MLPGSTERPLADTMPFILARWLARKDCHLCVAQSLMFRRELNAASTCGSVRLMPGIIALVVRRDGSPPRQPGEIDF
jgi:hypothetical protein